MAPSRHRRRLRSTPRSPPGAEDDASARRQLALDLVAAAEAATPFSTSPTSSSSSPSSSSLDRSTPSWREHSAAQVNEQAIIGFLPQEEATWGAMISQLLRRQSQQIISAATRLSLSNNLPHYSTYPRRLLVYDLITSVVLARLLGGPWGVNSWFILWGAGWLLRSRDHKTEEDEDEEKEEAAKNEEDGDEAGNGEGESESIGDGDGGGRDDKGCRGGAEGTGYESKENKNDLPNIVVERLTPKERRTRIRRKFPGSYPGALVLFLGMVVLYNFSAVVTWHPFGGNVGDEILMRFQRPIEKACGEIGRRMIYRMAPPSPLTPFCPGFRLLFFFPCFICPIHCGLGPHVACLPQSVYPKLTYATDDSKPTGSLLR